MPDKTDFKSMRIHCDSNSSLSGKVIDDFLMHFAARQENLEREMEKCLARYQHITLDIHESWVNRVRAQYIAHRLFKAGGLIKKYINHAELRRFSGQERIYLEWQLQNRWRYSFSVILDNPAKDFYRMEDVLSGKTFLLFSPAITETLLEQPAKLWFNLIAFNGSCWQTFGPIGAYTGFDADDVFFYATELNPSLESEEDIIREIDANPIPFNMLVAGAALPRVVSRGVELILLSAEHDLDSFDTSSLRSRFTIEYNKGVYKLSLRGWDELPHFSVAYYNEKKKMLQMSAMSEQGFDALASQLNASGYQVPHEAHVGVSPNMLTTTEKILRKKIRLTPYESLFEVKPSPGAQADIDKLNKLLAMILPEINAGKDPDIDMFAKKAGVDVELVRNVVENAVSRIKKLRDEK
jgi:hypothetical protein